MRLRLVLPPTRSRRCWVRPLHVSHSTRSLNDFTRVLEATEPLESPRGAGARALEPLRRAEGARTGARRGSGPLAAQRASAHRLGQCRGEAVGREP